jgi:hypothetical protein
MIMIMIMIMKDIPIWGIDGCRFPRARHELGMLHGQIQVRFADYEGIVTMLSAQRRVPGYWRRLEFRITDHDEQDDLLEVDGRGVSVIGCSSSWDESGAKAASPARTGRLRSRTVATMTTA